MSIVATANRFFKEIQLVSRILPSDQYYRYLYCIASNFPTLVQKKSLGIVDSTFGESFTVKWREHKLKFDKLGFGVAREIYGHCCYAQPGDLKNAKHILDLGANGGAFTLFALVEAPQAKVCSVEAQSDMVNVLQYNAEQNGYSDRLTIETAVVGGFFNDWTQEQRHKNPELQVFKIHDYINRVGCCDFLKCDVEGGEFYLFQGDLNWTNTVQTMAIEYHPECGSVSELEKILKEQGFKVKKVDHGSLGYFYCSRA